MPSAAKKEGKPQTTVAFEDAVRFSFTLPHPEALAVEAAAQNLRRKTGDLVHRAELIRAALLHFVGMTEAQQFSVLNGVERLKRGPKL